MRAFDPALFLQLAERLVERGEDEAWYRTSVSRAYYACFLKAREALRSRGLPFTGGPEDHRLVAKYLREALGRGAAYKLGRLRMMRNEADYDVGKAVDRSAAEKAVFIARSLMAATLKL